MSDAETTMDTPAAERAHQERGQPESLRFRAVAPIMTVNDLEASLRWYCDVLGCVKTREWKDADGNLNGVTVRAGSIDFNLGQDDFAKGRDRTKGVGFRLYCTTAQDIDQLAERIKAHGGELSMEPTDMDWGARVMAVTDPDGFQISIGSEMPDD